MENPGTDFKLLFQNVWDKNDPALRSLFLKLIEKEKQNYDDQNGTNLKAIEKHLTMPMFGCVI